MTAAIDLRDWHDDRDTLDDMDATRPILDRFRPLSLAEVGSAALMERIDRKYSVPLMRVPDLLASCLPNYRLLAIDGIRVHRYHTLYLDSGDLALYHAHHAGRAVRAKVRVRTYVDSATRYLEVKRRRHSGRTDKQRISLSGAEIPPAALHAAREWLADAGMDAALALAPVVSVEYSRLTLVHDGGGERVTIDVGLRLRGGDRVVSYPSVAFVEVKQEALALSPAVAALRGWGIRPGLISKYCLGVAHLVPRARTNRFKGALARLHAVGGYHAE